MKTVFRFAVVAAALPLVAAAAPAAVDGELLDRVWSGHPVTFALLTQRGH